MTGWAIEVVQPLQLALGLSATSRACPRPGRSARWTDLRSDVVPHGPVGPEPTFFERASKAGVAVKLHEVALKTVRGTEAPEGMALRTGLPFVLEQKN